MEGYKEKASDEYKIYSYKHDGTLHRVWEKNYKLYENESVLIGGTHKSRVFSEDNRKWNSELSICIFFSNKWFNIIAMPRPNGVRYYCNITSPYLYEDNIVKYVDYDLDLQVFPSYEKEAGKTYKILDYEEFLDNLTVMNYPSKLVYVLQVQFKELIEMVKNEEGPFKDGAMDKWFDKLNKKLHNEEQKRRGKC